MKKIPLSKGMSAIIDDEDYELVSKYKWHVKNSAKAYPTPKWYASSYMMLEGKQKTVFMHRLILDRKHGDGTMVDHIGNTLDNRKENLRIVSPGFNARRKNAQTGTSSKYPGVSWSKQQNRWRADIRYKGKLKNLGFFHTESEAWQAKVNYIIDNDLEKEGYRIDL